MPYHYAEMRAQIKRVLERVERAVYDEVSDLDVRAWVTSEPVSYDLRMSGTERHLRIGEKWGDLFDCAWFRFTGRVPERARGKRVVLLIDINGEACIVDRNGNPLQGLTNVSSEFDRRLGRPGKRVVQVSDRAAGGEEIDVWADAGCNDLFGRLSENGTLKQACIAVCNEQLRCLYYDFEVLNELMEQLPPESARRHSILWALHRASNMMTDYTDREAASAREILKCELAKTGGDPSMTVSAVGHAHIDLAWLWPIRETIRKGARTWSTALAMMDRYPDYVFGASQPQLYQWIKDYYPDLYRRIRERVTEGRWELQGAMWVEADTNITGGESLVRQILYGKRFFRDEYGKDIRVMWLPDVFGYSGALPQIMKKSGVDYFMTTKLSWNKVNQMPHHTFLWEGIDGTRVLTHTPPEGTYNSSAAPRAIADAERAFLDKGVSDRCLLVFGIGDGGGGPGEEHLERLQREKDLCGLAPVVQEPSIDFFESIESDSQDYHVWTGELYLETHQGTYTTQARNKWYNRKLEIGLRQLEYESVLAMLTADYPYPQEEIEELWKELLLYQFHDILPGSSIARVYDESLERYSRMTARVDALTRQVREAWSGAVDLTGKENPVVVINSLSFPRREWVGIDGRWKMVCVPPMGYTVVDVGDFADEAEELSALGMVLENDKVRVTFGADGAVVSVYDKECRREVIAEGSVANRLAVYEDPGDAWDFAPLYNQAPADHFVLTSSHSRVDGPRAVMQHTYVYGDSMLEQEIVLTSGSKRIDFITEVDWRESGKMLRTSFPTRIFAPMATCNIQFGDIERPTHTNTTWDMARFEVCGHKWVDISQRDYGVALLNDSKYGYRLDRNILDLNLLRSTHWPGNRADRAKHAFTYALYPHEGDHVTGRVAEVGYELNHEIEVSTPSPSHCRIGQNEVRSLVQVSTPNVIVETVKKAEDNGDVILRLYESCGAGVTTKLTLGFPFESVELVDVMEVPCAQDRLDGAALRLTFGPYEIHTLRIRPQREAH